MEPVESYDCFISYKSEDRRYAELVFERLKPSFAAAVTVVLSPLPLTSARPVLDSLTLIVPRLPASSANFAEPSVTVRVWYLPSGTSRLMRVLFPMPDWPTRTVTSPARQGSSGATSCFAASSLHCSPG